VRSVPAWGDLRVSSGSGATGRGPPVRPVRLTGQTGARQGAGQFGFRARDDGRLSSFVHSAGG
jgi:hypothetical protein